MDRDIQMRLRWVQLFEETGDAGVVCRRCGISRPTLRKWIKRFREQGLEGLKSQSRQSKRAPNRKVFPQQENWILGLRQERNLGARRIQNEIRRQHNLSLSLSTIQKVRERHHVKPLRRPARNKKSKRYQKEIPGERVQMDTCKIGPGLYQYTLIDDCTRYLVAGLYPRRTGANTLLFLDQVFEELPFPVQRVQTDRGTEFFDHKVQERLFEWGIKFRPVKSGSPHLNGKVERVQKTILDEFYTSVDLDAADLADQLAEWVFFYNWFRVHGSLGMTPNERLSELSQKTPYWDDVDSMFEPGQEFIRAQSYLQDSALQKLKRCL